MLMVLYKTADSENVINKELTEIHRTDVKMKMNISVTVPTIVLNDLPTIPLIKSNYCYLEQFDRYYFIRDIRVDGKLISLELECDVLESFKADILNSNITYQSEIKEGDYSEVSEFNSGVVPITVEYDSDVVFSEGTVKIMSTLGSV